MNLTIVTMSNRTRPEDDRQVTFSSGLRQAVYEAGFSALRSVGMRFAMLMFMWLRLLVHLLRIMHGLAAM